ncbi:hypothetical protein DFJ58DRAFT_839659 [Suillus subalutaceus]|uniref:uncharacterized protein n=1 Tax=Suillus subalutaceus TaxID=48586 RepID=UPI001B882113|nr:uncharacterized protein DFJ58DRAFT_839659 [Suillus subalutaceus]KAG1861511.1 hypothetical protein DFJ58DRAFT_839659 [Suillus subalutaceus]
MSVFTYVQSLPCLLVDLMSKGTHCCDGTVFLERYKFRSPKFKWFLQGFWKPSASTGINKLNNEENYVEPSIAQGGMQAAAKGKWWVQKKGYLEQVCRHWQYALLSCQSSATSSHPVDCRNLSCSAATQEKCEAWLKRRYAYPLKDAEPLMGNCSFMDGTASPVPGFTSTHEVKCKSVILNCIGPLLPLLNSWVTVDIQEVFYDALCTEQACQAGLMACSLTVNLYQRNIELEMLILQAKMHHAKAEIELYIVAIQNAHELDFSDITSVSSSASEFIPPPRPDKLCFYDEDCDDVMDNFDDFQL